LFCGSLNVTQTKSKILRDEWKLFTLIVYFPELFKRKDLFPQATVTFQTKKSSKITVAAVTKKKGNKEQENQSKERRRFSIDQNCFPIDS